eukprot:1328710-Karenia_brevis.AAC.1
MDAIFLIMCATAVTKLHMDSVAHKCHPMYVSTPASVQVQPLCLLLGQSFIVGEIFCPASRWSLLCSHPEELLAMLPCKISSLLCVVYVQTAFLYSFKNIA